MKVRRYRRGVLSGTLLAALAGCGSPGVPRPPSLNLPEPVADLRAIRKGDHVNLSWTVPAETTDNRAIRNPGPTRICRSLQATIGDCSSPGLIAAVLLPPLRLPQPKSQQAKPAKSAEKVTATYSDPVPVALLSNDPAVHIFYAVSVLNKNDRTAGLSNIVSVPAVAALSPPADLNAKVTAEGIVLTWSGAEHSPDTPALQHVYRVYRRSQESATDTVVGALPLDAATLQLVDNSFEWEKTYSYRVTIVTLIHPEGSPATEFEGDDTLPVMVFAHDIFPPAVPTGLQAVFSAVGQQSFIDLVWAPDTESDLAGYNIYRRENGVEPVKLNSTPVTTSAFRDVNVKSGHTYIYSVSGIDIRGNESTRSQEASEAVP